MTFSSILKGLAQDHPAIRGVVFCDEEGEKVDSHIADPALDDFDLLIAGASFATLVPLLQQQAQHGRARLRVNHGEGLIWMQMLDEHYYLLVLSHHGPTAGLMGPHLETVAEAIVLQM